jgi:hypothetical protein
VGAHAITLASDIKSYATNKAMQQNG